VNVSSRRSDSSFKNREQEEHHTGRSSLEDLKVGMVTNFPLDPMHLVYLGVTRKLLLAWIKGPLKVRLRSRDILTVSERMVQLRSHIPAEFSRKPRALKDILHFKATEYRLFLLYTGTVVLRGILPNNLFSNFLLLSSAIFILATKNASNSVHNNLAQSMINKCNRM